ncbi:MAG: branched-chain amino acid ABC transporter permease [Nitrospirae bacterium]|nr:branched-chain amino acid ABC transporter permease [Nitrospirota bacterium]
MSGSTALKQTPNPSSVKSLFAFAVGLIILFAWPLFAQYTPIFTSLATEIIIFSLFGIAYNMALGYTGLISLGHAAFFGFGGYFTGAMLKFFGLPVILSLMLALVASSILGVVFGFICLRKTGVYFTLVTLAISQMLYYVAQMWIGVTGGHEGMAGIPRLGLGQWVELTNNPKGQYWFVASVAGISVYMLWRMVNSSFGKVMQAVRENEERANTCGYNTKRVKYVAFIISGAFSGLAGSLYLISQEFFGIENIYWTMSGAVLIITLFGGTEVFLGPFVGALLFLLMKDSFSHYFEYWQILTGTLFVAVVLFLPEGILGSIVTFFSNRVLRRLPKKEA